MHGDCSIQLGPQPFTPEEITATAQRQGLLSIEIELSANPQCTCPDCQSTTPQSILSQQEILSTIDQAQALGARRILLIDSNTGPYPHLQSLIENLLQQNLQVELFTNDTPLTDDFAKYLINHQVDVAMRIDRPRSPAPLNRAGFSPSPGTPGEDRGEGDSIRRSTFDVQRAAFDLMRTSNIERPTLNIEQRKSQLSLRIPLTQKTLPDIPTQWRQARTQNLLPKLQILTAPNDSPSPEQIRQLFQTLAQIDHEEFNYTWPTDPSLTARSCHRHQYATHLTACGNIFPCVGVTIPLGNVRTESLKDILQLSDVLEDLRAYKEKVKEPCHTCTQSVPCYGCRGSAYQTTGDYLAGDELCWKAESTEIESLPINVAHIIPHGPSIRMVDQLVQIGERKSNTTFTIPKDSAWLDDDNRLDESAYIEIIAQSFASSHGFQLNQQKRDAHRGLLLGVKDLIIHGQAHAGDKLKIQIRKLTRFGDFGIVEGEVRHDDGNLIASAQVKVWRPGDETAKGFIE